MWPCFSWTWPCRPWWPVWSEGSHLVRSGWCRAPLVIPCSPEDANSRHKSAGEASHAKIAPFPADGGRCCAWSGMVLCYVRKKERCALLASVTPITVCKRRAPGSAAWSRKLSCLHTLRQTWSDLYRDMIVLTASWWQQPEGLSFLVFLGLFWVGPRGHYKNETLGGEINRSQWHLGRHSDRLTKMRNWWALLLLRSSWHMLELCAIVPSLATKSDSCRFVCNNKSPIDSVHSSELLPCRNEWVVKWMSWFFDLQRSHYMSQLFLCYSAFGCTFCVLVLKGWGWNHKVALYFMFPPAPPLKIKRGVNLEVPKSLNINRIKFSMWLQF